MGRKLKDYSFGRVSISEMLMVLEICLDKLGIDDYIDNNIYECRQISYIDPFNKFKKMIRVKALFHSEYDKGGSTTRGYLYYSTDYDKTEVRHIKLKVYDRISKFK